IVADVQTMRTGVDAVGVERVDLALRDVVVLETIDLAVPRGSAVQREEHARARPRVHHLWIGGIDRERVDDPPEWAALRPRADGRVRELRGSGRDQSGRENQNDRDQPSEMAHRAGCGGGFRGGLRHEQREYAHRSTLPWSAPSRHVMNSATADGLLGPAW